MVAIKIRADQRETMRKQQRLCRGRSCGLGLALAGVLDRPEPLQLVWRQDRAELLLGALTDDAELFASCVGRDGSVSAQGSDLLIAIRKYGLELGGLIGSEAELLGYAHSLAVRVGASGWSYGLRGGRLLRIGCGRLRSLREGERP